MDDPESPEFPGLEPIPPFPCLQEAIDKVCVCIEAPDQGQIYLPFVTGKTAATLCIAERLVGLGGLDKAHSWP